jgi:hypothetical protein
MKKLLLVLVLMFSLSIANEKAATKLVASATAPALSIGAVWVDTSTGFAYVSLEGLKWTRFANFLP